MSNVALVTGANQGLGYALVAGLGRALPAGSTVYLGARDPARGAAAVEALRTEGLAPELLVVDVTDDASVAAAAALIRARHGGIDVVISNAAARMTRAATPASEVRTFVDTNNHGTHRVLRAFAPLLRDGARLLVVASSFGSLNRLAPSLHHHFDVSTRTLDDIARVMDDYAALVEAGRAEEVGWPAWINVASKVAQVASTKILARDLRDDAEARDLLFDAVCPGLVDTEASRPWFADMSAAQTPEVAARDVVWLATLPRGTRAPYGELVRHRAILPWTAPGA
ncbi:MAG: SDR family NAD(P)-dependent oxidoreductase [Deltaproteobacteria bacterium]|nr:SDR family NAD(P)-dependent oxidoreductase [Deltaproteobacteria bacterium]